jgi:hypothetical protein
LPLYNAVHQAGKAIAAAWAKGEWHAASHGLAQDSRQADGNRAKPSEWQDNILRFRVKPQKGRGMFEIVAATLGTARLTGRVELGALWSALPGASPPASADSRPLALPVFPLSYEEDASVPSLVSVCLRGQSALDDAEAVNCLLATLPGRCQGPGHDLPGEPPVQPDPWGPGVHAMWPKTDMQEWHGSLPPGNCPGCTSTTGHLGTGVAMSAGLSQ